MVFACLEPTAAATHPAVDDSTEYRATDCGANSSAAWERTGSYGNSVIDRDSAATTAFTAWIAVVTVNYTTAKNHADDSADTGSDITTTTAHRSVPATISSLCDRLRPRAGKRCFLNRRWSRLYRSGLDFVADVRILRFDRRRSTSRSGLVLGDSL